MIRAELIKKLTSLADVPYSEGEMFLELLLRKISVDKEPEQIFEIPELGSFKYHKPNQGNIAFTFTSDFSDVNLSLPAEKNFLNYSSFSISAGKPVFPISSKQTLFSLVHSPGDYLNTLDSRAERILELFRELPDEQIEPSANIAEVLDDNIFDELTDSTIDEISELSFQDPEEKTELKEEEFFSSLLKEDESVPELEDSSEIFVQSLPESSEEISEDTGELQSLLMIEEESEQTKEIIQEEKEFNLLNVPDDDELVLNKLLDTIPNTIREPESGIEESDSPNEASSFDKIESTDETELIDETESADIKELIDETESVDAIELIDEPESLTQEINEGPETYVEPIKPESYEIREAVNEESELIIEDFVEQPEAELEIPVEDSEAIPEITEEITEKISGEIVSEFPVEEQIAEEIIPATHQTDIEDDTYQQNSLISEEDDNFDLSEFTIETETSTEESKLDKVIQELEEANLESISEPVDYNEPDRSEDILEFKPVEGNEPADKESKELSFLELADINLEDAGEVSIESVSETIEEGNTTELLSNIIENIDSTPEDVPSAEEKKDDAAGNYQRVKSLTREFFNMSEVEQKEKMLTWDFGESEQLDKEIKAITRSFDEPIKTPTESREGFTIVQGKKATMEWTPGTLPDLEKNLEFDDEEDLVEEINLQLAEKHIPEETVTETIRVVRRERKKSSWFIITIGIFAFIVLAVLAYYKFSSGGTIPEIRNEVSPIVIERNDKVPVMIEGESDKQDENVPAFEQNFNTGSENKTELVKISDGIYQRGDVFYIQVSSWQTKSKVNAEANRYQLLGYQTEIQTSLLNSGTWYRLLIGEFNSEAEASNFLKN